VSVRVPDPSATETAACSASSDSWCSVKFLASPPHDLVLRSRSIPITAAEVDQLRSEAIASKAAADEPAEDGPDDV
jgi:hypothetical protein